MRECKKLEIEATEVLEKMDHMTEKTEMIDQITRAIQILDRANQLGKEHAQIESKSEKYLIKFAIRKSGKVLDQLYEMDLNKILKDLEEEG